MTFTEGYLTLIPGYFALLPAVPIGFWIVRRRADQRWTLLALLALVHIDLVIALTIFPIPIAGQEFYRQTRGLSGDNAVPFATISWQLQHLTLNTVRQLAGNVVVLAPLGIYGPGLVPALRDWRRFLLVAVAFGVGIELAQFAGSLLEGFSYRITDVDDAIMNATGAVATFFVWGVVERRGLVDRWLEARPRPTATET
jgi:glycopeptide antibiotics resistance protein